MPFSAHFARLRHAALHSGVSLLLLLVTSPAVAQINYEEAPIDYDTAPVSDRVTRVQEALDGGEATLIPDEARGYLASVLELLEIPVSSQVLVFSKTSLQLRKISRSKPRAIYFNDDTYVGFCQQGEMIEVASIDPQQGLVFYTIDQNDADQPRFIRDSGQCLSCHATSRTQGVPGGLVRSVFASSNGTPLLGMGAFVTDDRSPFKDRWGGWYVTGTHGDMRHMGNAFAASNSTERQYDRERGANVTSLDSYVNTEPYLTPHSDIVALMVLEHQVQMQNLMTLANFETRNALHYDGVMNEALERDASYQSDSTKRRIASVAEKVVKALLFVDEFALTSPVVGTSGFSEEFAKRGTRDSHGRSLRDFDLEQRMFRAPCSYLIESEQFDVLPEPVKLEVRKRLAAVLTGEDASKTFSHLTADDRTTIREILNDLKPGLLEIETSR